MILKFWLIDDLYVALYGRGVLNNLTGTPQYLSWLARKLRPHLGDTVLEIGAGIGTLRPADGAAGALCSGGEGPSASARLRNRFLRTPNVEIAKVEPGDDLTSHPGGIHSIPHSVLTCSSTRRIRPRWFGPCTQSCGRAEP